MGDPSSIGVLGIYLGNSSAPRSQTIVSTNFTNRSWAELVLLDIEYFLSMRMISASLITTNNINNMVIWMSAENAAATWWGTAGANNVLNSSTGTNNAFGEGSYADLTVSAFMTAAQITSGHSGFPAIVAALSSNASLAVFSAAVIKSKWACSHYGVQAAGSDDCIQGTGKKGDPFKDNVPPGYWTAGRSGPPSGEPWWGAKLSPRGLDYFTKVALPNEVTAPVSHGTNSSTANGVGWDWASPQAWQPNPGTPFPGEPNMSPAPPFLSIDPTNLANYDTTTGFIQPPSSPSTGGPIGGGGPATGPAGGGSTSSTTGNTTGNTTGGTTGSTVDTTDPGTGETGSTSETGNETPPPGEQ